jgi:hypothetical protein
VESHQNSCIPLVSAFLVERTINKALLLLFTGESYEVIQKESQWLEHVQEQMQADDGHTLPNTTWASYHAALETAQGVVHEPAVNSLLPLFYESSTSISMIRHGMRLIHQITRHVNKSQVPVMCVDQPLYALSKTIQWNFPEDMGENSLFIMMGSFHIEKAFLSVIGNVLEDSGWTRVIENSNLMTESAAKSILKVRCGDSAGKN